MLKEFSSGHQTDGSGLRARHLLHAVTGHTTPSADDFLHNLTLCMNFPLSSKASPLLPPWLCGAPLTAHFKKNRGIHPIAVGEILHCLAMLSVAYQIISNLMIRWKLVSQMALKLLSIILFPYLALMSHLPYSKLT